MIYLFSKRHNFLSYPDKRGAALCQKIVIEIVTEFLVEIGIEQTQLRSSTMQKIGRVQVNFSGNDRD